MIRVLFLILFLMSSVAFAQKEETPKAIKFEEFETATNGFIKMKMDAFYLEIGNNPGSQGYIINYGTDKEILVREKQFRNAMLFRKYDEPRFTFVRAGFWKNVKSELWVVPPGAENPEPSSNAAKLDEFEKISDKELSAKLDNLYVSLGKNPNSLGYILTFGSPQVVAAREQRIKKYIVKRKLVLSRVIFKNAGSDDVGKTELWITTSDDLNKKLKK